MCIRDRDKPTRARRDWQLDDDFEYAPEELDRSVQTPSQIRTIARALRGHWVEILAFHCLPASTPKLALRGRPALIRLAA